MWCLLKKYPDESTWTYIMKFPTAASANDARANLSRDSPFPGKLMILYQD